MIIAAAFTLAFGGATLAIFLPDGPFRWGSLAFGVAMLAVGVWLSRFVLKTLVARCAGLLLSPYQVQDLKTATDLLEEYLGYDYLPTIAIRQGQIAEGTDMTLLRRREQLDLTLQRTTGRGPAYLDVDRTSAVVLWQPGGYVLYQYGTHLYEWNQQFVGAVDLRQQSFQVDDDFWTLDGMQAHLKAVISYWVIQDAVSFRESQTHRAKWQNVQRAVMSTPDWRERTKRLLLIKVRDLMLQFALSDFFVTPTQLHGLDLVDTVKRVYAAQPHKELVQELSKRLIDETRERLAEIGVEVRSVIILSIAPPPFLAETAKQMYDAWLHQIHEEGKIERQARQDIENAKNDFQLAQIKQKKLMVEAETEKQVEKLKAEAEAESLETRMKARAVSAVEFARRMELVKQALGDSLDEATMRELMRALGLLVYERRYGYGRDSRSILDMFGHNNEEAEEEE